MPSIQDIRIAVFENIYNQEPHYTTLSKLLGRIKDCASSDRIDLVRNAIDKDRRDELKKNLPSVCFSVSQFERQPDSRFMREDKNIVEHSGLIVLDFDKFDDDDALRNLQTELINTPYVIACWVSPSANGLKALVRIADPDKHRQHFQALKQEWPDVDNSGVNPSRVCYESCDADIVINWEASVYTKTTTVEKIVERDVVSEYSKIFENILRWLSNKGNAFETGERNIFLFKLACACARFGIPQDETEFLFTSRYPLSGTDFSKREAANTIASAYRVTGGSYGTAVFESERLVDKITKSEVDISSDVYDENIPPKDVIYGEEVKGKAISIYNDGYENVEGIGIREIDDLFKLKRGEITLLSGLGNAGKSSFKRWYLLLHAIKHDRKFALFAPEDNPAEEFYHDLTETFLGCDLTPKNVNRPPQKQYEMAYDFVSRHFFYVYPKEAAPSPPYIKERFLEMIIKEGVFGCVIDPWNQMSNNYEAVGGRDDKYLEAALGDLNRFAVTNSIPLIIVAHPNKMSKAGDGNYPCPDVFDLAGGAMWNNKIDNILIYHRPFNSTDPMNSSCEFHSKKIRRQKIVGAKGMLPIHYDYQKRRYIVNGRDPIQELTSRF